MAPMRTPATTPARETSRATPPGSRTPRSRMFSAMTSPNVREARRSIDW